MTAFDLGGAGPHVGTLWELVTALSRHYPHAETAVSYAEWVRAEVSGGSGPMIVRKFSNPYRGLRFGNEDRGTRQELPGARAFFPTDNEAFASHHHHAMSALPMRGSIEENIDHQRRDQQKIWLHAGSGRTFPNPHRTASRLKFAHVLDAAKGIAEMRLDDLDTELRLRAYRTMCLLNVFAFPNNEYWELSSRGPAIQAQDPAEDTNVRRTLAAWIYCEVLKDAGDRDRIWSTYRAMGRDDLGLDAASLQQAMDVARSWRIVLSRKTTESGIRVTRTCSNATAPSVAADDATIMQRVVGVKRTESWKQLRRGCRDHLGRGRDPSVTPNVQNNAKAFATRARKATGLGFDELLAWMDRNGLATT